MEECLNIGLVEKQLGGNMGGRTVLIDQGKKRVNAYSEFGGDIENATERAYEKHIKELVKWVRQ